MCRLFGMTSGHARSRATFWLLDAPDSLDHGELVHVGPDLRVERRLAWPDPLRRPMAG